MYYLTDTQTHSVILPIPLDRLVAVDSDMFGKQKARTMSCRTTAANEFNPDDTVLDTKTTTKTLSIIRTIQFVSCNI